MRFSSSVPHPPPLPLPPHHPPIDQQVDGFLPVGRLHSGSLEDLGFPVPAGVLLEPEEDSGGGGGEGGFGGVGGAEEEGSVGFVAEEGSLGGGGLRGGLPGGALCDRGDLAEVGGGAGGRPLPWSSCLTSSS